MTSFYEKSIKDTELGPYFTHELGDDITDQDWIDHIELLADFWLAKILGEDTYYGNFVGAHVKMPRIKESSFIQWLHLFSETTDEVYTPDVAKIFKKRAGQLMQEFKTSKKKI
ncbi:group III truncated hemoglobin [Sulfurimonas sp.]|nr:group III truncated hemoglobin [Sulfurimonas sp.]